MNNEKAKQIIDKYFDEMKGKLESGWNEENAKIIGAFISMAKATGDKKYTDAVVECMDKCVAEDGVVAGFEAGKLSSYAQAVGLFEAFEATENEKYKTAAVAIAKQLLEQPRHKGLFVNDSNVADEIKLSGVCAAFTFYMTYETKFGGKEHYNDVATQLKKVRNTLIDEKTLLYGAGIKGDVVDAYDAHDNAAQMLNLIDCLEAIDQAIYEYYNEIKVLYKEMLKGELAVVDKEQCLFVKSCTVASMAKACRHKAILTEKYLDKAVEIMDEITEKIDDKMANGLKVKPMSAFMRAYSELVRL